MGVKVYFVYDGEGAPSDAIVGERMEREAYKAKITLPDSWMSGPVSKLVSFFCTTYSKKFPEKPLDPEAMKLRIGAVDLPANGTVSQFVQEHNDIFVLHQPAVAAAASVPEGSLVCGNYGCGKRFLEEENNDEACHHHAKGPVFHDTNKYWGCCPDHKALDWEQFEAIPKCQRGRHAVTNRPVTFQSPNAIENTALSAEQLTAMQQTQAQQQLASEGGKPRTGPREFEEARTDEEGPIAEDGTALCRNFGCGKRFVVSDNHDTACRHHAAGPVFWDTYKYWKCCPDRKHIDFDDFSKVEGCTVGAHRR